MLSLAVAAPKYADAVMAYCPAMLGWKIIPVGDDEPEFLIQFCGSYTVEYGIRASIDMPVGDMLAARLAVAM
jgi:hypothetical protein